MKTKFWFRFAILLGILAAFVILIGLVVFVVLQTPSPEHPNQQAAVSTATPAPITPTVAQAVTPAPPPNVLNTQVVTQGTTALASVAGFNLNRQITVILVGEAKAVPDVAYLNVGNQVQAATASEAMAKARSSSDAIYQALINEGIAENNIQTSGINIYPVQDSTSKTITSGPSSYQATFSMYISIQDLSKAGSILDSVTKAGANQISGLSYGLKDTTQLKAQALDQALKLAAPKAEAIATSLGLKIDQVITVSEEPSSYYDQTAYGLGGKSDAAGAISPGELTVRVQVSVSFSIK